MRISDWSSDVCSSDLCCCPPAQAKRYAGMKLPVFLGSIVLSLALWSTAGATTVFSTDFAGGIAGWATSGTGGAHQETLRLRGPDSAARAVSTAGYSATSVALTMLAGSLEKA